MRLCLLTREVAKLERDIELGMLYTQTGVGATVVDTLRSDRAELRRHMNEYGLDGVVIPSPELDIGL